MTRKTIRTDAAPTAIGPYSQAVLVDGWLWCSGQIALDPGSGVLAGNGHDEHAAREQAKRCLDNLDAVVRAAGGTLADAVRCTVYLADLTHFSAVNEVYSAYFTGAEPPARACVEVSKLPRGALVEIDCVARIQGSS